MGAATRVRVAVLGDSIVDEWYFAADGEKYIDTAGPDGQFLKLAVSHRMTTPGGAAAVCEALKALDVDTVRFMPAPRTIRTRVVVDGRVAQRLDVNPSDAERGEIAEWRTWAADRRLLEPVDAIIISDYGRGAVSAETVTKLVEQAPNAQIVLDARVGVSYPYLTPHWVKLSEEQLQQGAKVNDWDHPETNVIVTSKKGANVYQKAYGRRAQCSAPSPISVACTAGCGDVFIAAFVATMLRRRSLDGAIKEGCRLASWKARAFGVTEQHLREGLHRNEKLMRVSAWKDSGCVLTCGCFDVLHPGHIRHLKECAEVAERENTSLVVALNTDESVASLKTGRPFVPFEHRAEMLAAISEVDAIIPLASQDVLAVLGEVRPRVFCKDAMSEDAAAKEFLGTYGGRYHATQHHEDWSTTKIAEAIARRSGAKASGGN